MTQSWAGIHIKAGQVGVLELDGTLVYIESVTPVYAVAVALPDQSALWTPTAGWTPGRVGGRRISPFVSFLANREPLSEANKTFIETYVSLRIKHGPAYSVLDPIPNKPVDPIAVERVMKDAKAQREIELEAGYKKKRRTFKPDGTPGEIRPKQRAKTS